MPFIRQEKLEKLERAARNDADIKKIQKRFDRDLENIRTDYRDRVEDLEDEHAAQVRKLTRAARKTDAAVKEAVEEAKALHTASIAQVKADYLKKETELSESNKSLVAEKKVLEARVSTQAELTKRELDLADAEDEHDRSVSFFNTRVQEFEKDVAAFDKRKADAKDGEYKRGYTDGVSDTLREGQELASEANGRVYGIAEKALDKETVVITTSQAPNKSK